MSLFVPSSCNSAVSGAEESFREQPGYAEEAWYQTHPETRPHLPEAPFGHLEVRPNTSSLYLMLQKLSLQPQLAGIIYLDYIFYTNPVCVCRKHCLIENVHSIKQCW